MYVSKLLMEFLPNVHLIGIFVVATTVVYRKKALYPLYVFVFLVGLFNGFSIWWIPYLYIWTILWGFTMLIPTKLSPKVRYVLYPLVCAIHGYLYGTLYAPAQALLFHYSFKATITWIITGLPWDMVHGTSNLICGTIIIFPLIKIFQWMKNHI